MASREVGDDVWFKFKLQSGACMALGHQILTCSSVRSVPRYLTSVHSVPRYPTSVHGVPRYRLACVAVNLSGSDLSVGKEPLKRDGLSVFSHDLEVSHNSTSGGMFPARSFLSFSPLKY